MTGRGLTHTTKHPVRLRCNKVKNDLLLIKAEKEFKIIHAKKASKNQ